MLKDFFKGSSGQQEKPKKELSPIEKLIEEGYDVQNTLQHGDKGYGYIQSAEYARWLAYVNRYVNLSFPNSPEAKQVASIAAVANGGTWSDYENLMGILYALKNIPPVRTKTQLNNEKLLEMICLNFHKFAVALMDRRKDGQFIRETIEIQDEYDVQDLLNAILRLFFDEVIREDYTPKIGDKGARPDFHLPTKNIMIETKMTRESLRDGKVLEQLFVDIGHFVGKCGTLVFFIYDKGSYLKNPNGLIREVENRSTDKTKVKVYICP